MIRASTVRRLTVRVRNLTAAVVALEETVGHIQKMMLQRPSEMPTETLELTERPTETELAEEITC